MNIYLYKFSLVKKKIVFLIILLSTLLLLAAPYFQKAQLTVELDEIESYNHFQVFWKTKNLIGKSSGYSEKQSLVQSLRPGYMKLIVSIPSLKTVEYLRIDPATIATTFVLRSITVTQAGFEPVSIKTRQQFNNLFGFQDIDLVDIDKKGAVLRSLSTDPRFELNIQSGFSYLKYIPDKVREHVEIISQRMDLLGLDWRGFFFLGLDLLFLASISTTLIQRSGVKIKEPGELCISLGLTGLGVIIATTIFCGACYLLNWRNLLLTHIFIWFSLHAVIVRGIDRKIVFVAVDNFQKSLRIIFQPIGKILMPSDRRLGNYLNAVLLVSILTLLLYYLIPAAFTLPLNFDSNDYRLSRVGYWLQEGHVWQFPTNDIRQIIMPSNCDLAMLWITSFFQKGYPLVHLISFAAGLLTCGTIYAFMSLMQFQLYWRLIGIIFWLGIPNSASEMLTSQTDLFTTGCLISGLFFLYRAIKENTINYYLLAGMGIGLAVGGKSTVFLWGPGLLFLFLCLLFFYRSNLRLSQFVKGMSVLIITLIVMGGFVYAQNQVRYGNFLGPKLTVASIKDNDQAVIKKSNQRHNVSRPLSKLDSFIFRAKMYTWQVFAPGSTLEILHPVSNYFFNTLENDIREKGKFIDASFLRRFDTATSWLRKIRMSEDYASFGLIPFTLFCIGGIVAFFRALTRRDSQSVAASTLFVVTLLYMLFFCYIVGWTAHRFRYAVLVTPLIAFISVYLLSVMLSCTRSRRFVPVIVVCLIMFYQLSMSVNVAHSSRTHGWPSFKSPSRAHNYVFYWYDMHRLVEQLPENVKNIGLFLSKGSWKALLFRTGKDLKAYYVASDEQLTVNNDFFKENNFDGLVTKGLSSVSVVGSYNMVRSQRDIHHALIKVDKGEQLYPWMLKKGIWRDGWTAVKGRLIFSNWEKQSFTVTLCNPTNEKRIVIVKSSQQTLEQIFDVNECCDIRLKVKENDIVKWSVQPGYYPWKHNDGKDKRSLGLKITLPD